jgi:hypothetical protein
MRGASRLSSGFRAIRSKQEVLDGFVTGNFSQAGGHSYDFVRYQTRALLQVRARSELAMEILFGKESPR